MQKLIKSRYYIAFILALCLFFAAIISLHSYYNLQAIIKPASDQWGRTTSLGAEDLFKKQPSVLVSDNYTDILVANKSNFTHTRINRSTRETTREPISIKGVESYRVQKFDWDENNIYFIESSALYYVTKNPAGGYSAKTKIVDEVNDFDIVNTKGNVVLAVAQKDGVILYQLTDKGFQQYSSKYKIDKLSNIAVIQDNQGIIHVAAYAVASAIDFPVYYLTLQDEKWNLLGSVVERSMAEAWSINDIDIGIDDTDVYIFYAMVKWDKFGVAAKTHNAVVPISSEKVDLKFNRFYLSEKDSKDMDSFLNEPRLIKTQGNNIKLSVIKDSYDKKNKNGFSSYLVTMDKGKISDISRVTNNQRLMSNTAYQEYKGDNIFLFLDAAGGFNYEAFYTETGKSYFSNAIKPTKDDISIAIMDTIPGYVSTFVVSFIKISLYFPIILWFLIIEFFEIKKMKKRPKLTYGIGFVLYLIMKVATFGNYYSALAVSQMPPVLTFTGAKYFYAIAITFLAFLIQKLLKKHNPEMHLITEFIIFALIDIEFTNLLYATYMV